MLMIGKVSFIWKKVRRHFDRNSKSITNAHNLQALTTKFRISPNKTVLLSLRQMYARLFLH